MKQTISKSNNTHQTDQPRRPIHHSYVAAAVLLLVSLLYAGVMLHWFVVDHTLAFSWSYAIPSLAIRWHTIMVIAEIWLAAGLGWLVGYVAHRGSTQPWRGPVACAAASAITYVMIVASLNGPIATFVVSLGILYTCYRLILAFASTDLPWMLVGFIILMVSGVLFASVFIESGYTRRQIEYRAVDSKRQR